MSKLLPLSEHTVIDFYSKTCVKRPLSKTAKIVFQYQYRLLQAKRIAECSKGSIMQYFRPILI